MFEGSAFVGEIEGLLLDEARRQADGIVLMLNSAIIRKETSLPPAYQMSTRAQEQSHIGSA